MELKAESKARNLLGLSLVIGSILTLGAISNCSRKEGPFESLKGPYLKRDDLKRELAQSPDVFTEKAAREI